MNTVRSEHERICDLEALVPDLTARLDSINHQLAGLASGAPVTRAGGRPSSSPVVTGPFLLAFSTPALFADSGAVSFESEAAAAGELVSEAEDAAADLKQDLDNIEAAGESVPPEAKTKQTAAAAAAQDLLVKAREAKNKAAGAAVAAKKFEAAKPHIKDAEDSFNEARKRLLTPEAGTTVSAKFNHRTRLLKEAQQLLEEDIDKLKEALSAITGA